MPIDPPNLTPEDFADHRSTVFEVHGLSLVLADIETRPEQPHAPRRHPFTLVFTGPPETPLRQGTHPFVHPVLGTVEIFIVPIGPGPDGAHRYEAVFN